MTLHLATKADAPRTDHTRPKWFRVTIEGHNPVTVMAKDRLAAIISILTPLGLRYRDTTVRAEEVEAEGPRAVGRAR